MKKAKRNLFYGLHWLGYLLMLNLTIGSTSVVALAGKQCENKRNY
jgi:hypothetical protein